MSIPQHLNILLNVSTGCVIPFPLGHLKKNKQKKKSDIATTEQNNKIEVCEKTSETQKRTRKKISRKAFGSD